MPRFLPLCRLAVLSAVVTTMLVACATDTRQQARDDQRLAAYAAAAGAAVRTFRLFGPLYSWEPLGNEQLVVYTRPTQAWLLDVSGCSNLSFTNTIGLTSNMHQVTVMLDEVLTGRGDFPCTITRARPLDVRQLKATQQARRKIEERPREVPAGT